jgi:hypothetical protein
MSGSDYRFTRAVGEDIVVDLEAVGLTKECIPQTLGGTCSREHFLEWFENCRTMDETAYSLPSDPIEV